METQTLLGLVQLVWIVFQFMHQFLQKKLRWVIPCLKIILAHLNFFCLNMIWIESE
jgi:hypothetical protein